MVFFKVAEKLSLMKISKLLALLLLLPTTIRAAAVVSPPGNFSGGLNQSAAESDILENETPDSNNMVNTLTGAAEKRRGSRLFISQAVSTNPIASLYRAYGSSVSGQVVSAILAATLDRILVSTGGANPLWVVAQSSLAQNRHWNFTTIQNKVIMGDDDLTSPILQYDLMTASMTTLTQQFNSTSSVSLRAKYVLNSMDQILLANVLFVSTPAALVSATTNYDSRLYYSFQFYPSSYATYQYLAFDEDDGEEIAGVSEKDKVIHVWKKSKIFEVDVGAYGSLQPLHQGGTYSIRTVVKGFGLFAPRSLVNTGDFYIFADAAGVRFWDGAQKTRLQVEQESRIVSDKIKPLIERCVAAGTWDDAVATYYPNRGWYMLSVEDPTRSPKGRQNLVIVLDLTTLSWFRFTNLDAASWAVWDGAGDKGQLTYGSSSDGYVYFADDSISANDAKRELPLNNMDTASDWARGIPELVIIKEGTASVRMTASTELRYTSITWMNVINAGEWQDKTRVDKNDLFTFKLFGTSIQFITQMRMDLQVEDVSGDFNVNFTSVTFSSGVFNTTAGTWTEVSVAFSSFVILSTWTDLAVESIPFADTLTFFGVRIFATGTAGFNLYVDDMRIKDNTERPLSAYRWTKQFTFGSASNKEFKEVWLNAEVPPDGILYIDTYKDFGTFVDRSSAASGGFGKEIFVGGFNGRNNLTRLDGVTFAPMDSTDTVSNLVFSFNSLATDKDFIYAGDQYNNRLVKINKSSFTAFVSTYGSLGTGTTNFNFIGQIGMDAANLFVTDVKNHRVKVHRKSDLQFVAAFGQLGSGTTSFHLPQGVAVDGDGGNLYVANDGNFNILKLDKNTGAFKASVSLDLDTYGEPSLAVDDRYLYVAYRSFSPNVLYLELILEKRDKASMAVLDKTVIRPQGVDTVSVSTYAYEGDISLSGDYIYMVFTDDINLNGHWYLQKRLRSDFSIVKELISSARIGTVSANEMAYSPARKTLKEPLGTSGAYVQLKYSDGESLDNPLKLYNQAFKLEMEALK